MSEKTFKSLQEKLQHARSLDHPLPSLPYSDLVELFTERSKSDNSYLTYIDQDDNRTELSYREFADLVLKTARFLQSKGLEKGDRIATASHNHWHTVIHYFASWILGLVVVPINLGEDDDRIEYILQTGKVKLIFARNEYRDRLQQILKKRKSLLQIKLVLCDETIDSFTMSEGKPDLAQNLGEDEALIVFTSGTTGAPKAVVLSQRNLLEDARSISEWHTIHSGTR